MNALIKHTQIIENNGKPAFAVIPYIDFVKIKHQLEKTEERTLIPHDVVVLNVLKGMSMIKAWRTHLKMTQAQLAQKAGITQAALSQIEKSGAKTHKATLKKIADAMNLTVEHFS